MASNYTKNYGLCQWEATDQVRREEFNQDNQKVDEALAGKAELSNVEDLSGRVETLEAQPHWIVGTYTGNGEPSQIISLGKKPSAVFALQSNGYLSQQYQTYYFGGLALPDHPVKTGSHMIVEIKPKGFCVYEDDSEDINANSSGVVYHYMALL